MQDAEYYEPEVETMPRAEIERLQEERLLELVPRAYRRGRLYRELWDAAGVHPREIRSLDDFRERIPCMDKDSVRRFRDVHGDPYGGTLLCEERELSLIATSSGTTGDATFFPEIFEERRWSTYLASSARDLWHLGVRPGTYYMGGISNFKGAPYQPVQLCGAIPLMPYFWFGNWDVVFDVMREFKPKALMLIGPMLVEMAEHARSLDLKALLEPVGTIIFAGEPLGAKLRRKIAEWGPELYMFTSAGDCGTSWECREHDGYHVWEDNVIVECLDPDGDEPCGEGEIGELVTTCIDKFPAPLIRYRSEDLVRITREPCACGRTHLRQWPLGRKGDHMTVRGIPVTAADLWSALEEVPETENGIFQVIRPWSDLAELRMRVGYLDLEGVGVGKIRDRAAAAIAGRVGVEPVLEMIPEPELLARGMIASKFVRVVKR